MVRLLEILGYLVEDRVVCKTQIPSQEVDEDPWRRHAGVKTQVVFSSKYGNLNNTRNWRWRCQKSVLSRSDGIYRIPTRIKYWIVVATKALREVNVGRTAEDVIISRWLQK